MENCYDNLTSGQKEHFWEFWAVHYKDFKEKGMTNDDIPCSIGYFFTDDFDEKFKVPTHRRYFVYLYFNDGISEPHVHILNEYGQFSDFNVMIYLEKDEYVPQTKDKMDQELLRSFETYMRYHDGFNKAKEQWNEQYPDNPVTAEFMPPLYNLETVK